MSRRHEAKKVKVMIVRSVTILLFGLFTAATPAYADANRVDHFTVDCMFTDPSLINQKTSTIPLNWKFNSRLFGIFGPGIVSVDDPKGLLGGREITRVTAKKSMIFFAATRSPSYSADESAMFIGIMKSPDKSHFPVGIITSVSDNKMIRKFSGRCRFVQVDAKVKSVSDAVSIANSIFDSMINYYRTELGQ